MEQTHWRDDLVVIVRPEDGERIGYLRQWDEHRWEPMNLLGVALGEPDSRTGAVRTVTSDAMPSIGGAWWCRAPRPLTEPLLDARAVAETEEWQRMVVVELTPDRALLRPMYAWPEETGRLLEVALPATGVVHMTEPSETT